MLAKVPHVVALAGPNGAGKSTAATRLLRGILRVEEFVNADLIVGGISTFHPDRVAMAS
jgi:predicted ABC-type ATPase